MRKDWPREDFFDFLYELARASGIPDTKKGTPNLAELARRSGVNPTQLSNWLNGKARPSRENLARIAPVLHVAAIKLEIAAGITDPAAVGLDEVDLTVLPRSIVELHERWANAVEHDPGFATEIERHVQMVNEWVAGQEVLRERSQARKP